MQYWILIRRHTRSEANAYGEAEYERPANTHDKATFAAQINARAKQAHERHAITRGEATLERVSCNV